MHIVRGALLLLIFQTAIHARDTEGIEFFESHIRPVLVEHCYQCHSGESKKLNADLYLDSREGILRGGDSGAAIVPGKPDESILLEAVEYEDHAFKMPPKYKLDAVDIRNIRKWIQMGAPDPRQAGSLAHDKEQAGIDIEAGRTFWAFQPIGHPQPPAVDNQAWPLDEIDNFVLAKLEANNLTPNERADAGTLVRRVYFDLVGLPPTPEQIDEYVDAPAQENLAKIVDRLLASPEFGERWGRHWLDVARFAESSGGGRSMMFEHAWRYRDYVIDALNKDKPFDQFIVEQLAGDLLPSESAEEYNEQLTASGYLMLGALNYELQDKELLRMELIDEQIDTVGRGFLGMTLGCARCHDHKFDPIPTRDYYAMAGIFGSTQSLFPGNISGVANFITQPLRLLGKSKADMLQMKEANAKKTQLAGEITKLEKQLKQAGAIQGRGVNPSRFQGMVIDDHQAKLVGNWTSSTSVSGFLGDRYLHDEGEEKGKNRAVFSPVIERGGMYEVRVSYTPGTNRATSVPVIIHHQDGRTERRIDQTKKPPIAGAFVSVGSYRFEANTKLNVTIETGGTDGVVIVDAVQFLRAEEKGNVTKNQNRVPSKPVATTPKATNKKDTVAIAKLRNKQRKLEAELKALRKQWPIKRLDVVMSVKDADKTEDSHILIRGAVRKHGPLVKRGFLQVAMKLQVTPPEIPQHQSGRLQLAQWIASEENPLTSRVFVNRIWHHLFGAGLVRTTDNFGKMGERPSHPELLDYLATEFTADGWSTKRMIKRLVLSRSYQMSSDSNAEKQSIDIENRLLWRANRKQLEAEAIRDAMLSISGQMDPTRGGLTIRKIATYDLAYQFDTLRRSVYVPSFRNNVLDLFEVFDMANPNLVIGCRTPSVLPTQSLFMMNSPFVIKLARETVASHSKSFTEDPTATVRYLYRNILGRHPQAEELQLAIAYLNSFQDDKQTEAKVSLCHSLFASIDFRTLY